MNALVLQLGGLRPGVAFPDVEWLVTNGWTVTLVVSVLPDGAQVPAGVEVVEVGDLEQVGALWRAERFVVLAGPSGAMRKLRALVTKLGGIRGLGRPARTVGGFVISLHAFQYRASRGLHNRWMAGPYRVLRPLWLWRLLRRSALDELLRTKPDLVVCADRDAIATAWHLARRYPDVEVTYGVNRVRPIGVSVPEPVSA
ncbi:MAG: hypothetical protein QOG34_2131 [Frankiaceae bacterium]|jgi:hypothetical protein|nr:hypothetical protein [Frankiaceae bacterium]